MTVATATTTTAVDIKFTNADSTSSEFSYADGKFTLNADLNIGTLEQIAQSGASVLGDNFPDTSNIPVLGALMNKISFTLGKTFYYTEATATTPDYYNVPLTASVTGQTIGAATLNSATITLTKVAAS